MFGCLEKFGCWDVGMIGDLEVLEVWKFGCVDVWRSLDVESWKFRCLEKFGCWDVWSSEVWMFASLSSLFSLGVWMFGLTGGVSHARPLMGRRIIT